MNDKKKEKPKGEPALRTLAMPADTNPSGDIFGGWVLSQMDIAGALVANKLAKGRVATVAIDSMMFHLPVNVGDVVCCYANTIRTGNTSITMLVQVWVLRQNSSTEHKVTEGEFTYVAIGDDKKPRAIFE